MNLRRLCIAGASRRAVLLHLSPGPAAAPTTAAATDYCVFPRVHAIPDTAASATNRESRQARSPGSRPSRFGQKACDRKPLRALKLCRQAPDISERYGRYPLVHWIAVRPRMDDPQVVELEISYGNAH